MSCAVCGEETVAGALFCHECGSLIEPVRVLHLRAYSHRGRSGASASVALAPVSSVAPVAPASTSYAAPSAPHTSLPSEARPISDHLGVVRTSPPTSGPDALSMPTVRVPPQSGSVPAPRGGRSPLVALAVIVLALVFAALVRPFVPVTAPPRGVPTSGRAGVGTVACSARLDDQVSSNVADMTLASAVTNVGGAYLPVVPTQHFRPGQHVYVTFLVATAARGTIDARFCVGSHVIPGHLVVPAGFQGHSGQFTATLPADISSSDAACTVVIEWNGHVAARLPFTVSG